MNATLTAGEVLARSFLDVRFRLLDVAASLDRIDRAAESASVLKDPRMMMLREAMAILVDGKQDRACRLQMTFSLPYNERWQEV